MRNVHKDIINNLFHHTLAIMMGWNTQDKDTLPYYYIKKDSFGYRIVVEVKDAAILSNVGGAIRSDSASAASHTMIPITTHNISGAPKSGRELIAWMDGIIYFVQHPQLKDPFRSEVVTKLLR